MEKVPDHLPPLATTGSSCNVGSVPDESLQVSADRGLANVLIWLKDAPHSGSTEAEEPAPKLVIDNCQFEPRLQIVRASQPLTISNSDNSSHRVKLLGFDNSYSKELAADDSQGQTIQFRSAELVPLEARANGSPWMTAWILPLDHSWAAITDENGRFEIKNVPAGPHEFVIWHERAGYLARALRVEVPERGEVTKEIVVRNEAVVKKSKT